MFRNKKKSQKWLDALDKGAAEECNNPRDRALLETGARLKRSVTHDAPSSDTFRERLYANLREQRLAASKKPMTERTMDFFSRFIRSRRLLPAVALVVLVAIVATLLPVSRNTDRTGIAGLLIISEARAEDNFSVEATKQDALGVDSSTQFIIKSKETLDTKALEEHITLTPAVDFTLQKVNDKTFVVTPKALSGRTVYRLEIDAAYRTAGQLVVERNFSWAFQVKDEFKVLHTLPRDEATRVPQNSGIEVTFSQDAVDLKDFEKAFSIQPSVDGRFEKHKRTFVFVPKALLPGTIYKVTVKKSLPLGGSDLRLKEDVVIYFETENDVERDARRRPAMRFADRFIEFSPSRAPVIPVYGSEKKEVTVEVYAFPSGESFAQEWETARAIPGWSYYARETKLTSKNNLSKIKEIAAPVYELNWNKFIAFPESLPRGFYLLELNDEGGTSQMFLQVSELSVYTAQTRSDTLVWVHNLQSSQPAANARVSVRGSGASAVTDAKGVARLENKNFPSNGAGNMILVSDGANETFVPIASSEGASEWKWKYVYTDRSLYLPNDTVRYFGFIKPVEGAIDANGWKVRIQGAYDRYTGEPIVLTEKNISMNNGYIDGELPLEHITPGYHQFSVLHNDKVISTSYIDVQTYVKPAYRMSIERERQAVFAGEPLVASLSASFYDGTPVARLAFNHSFGKGVTDENGKAALRQPTTPCSSGGGCDTHTVELDAAPAMGEEGDIGARTWFTVYGSSVLVDVDAKQESLVQGKITAKVHAVDLQKINRGETTNPRGAKAAGVPVTGRIKEISYERIETGEYYDFINKVTNKTYRYQPLTKDAGTFSGVTNEQGEFTHAFAIESGKNYEIYVTAADAQGRLDETRAWVYAYERLDEDAWSWYDLQEEADHPDGYSIGESVGVAVHKNGQPVAKTTGEYLFYAIQDGVSLFDVKPEPSYRFNFEESFVPNVSVHGVWFDGKKYREVNSGGWLYDGQGLVIRFKSKDRQLSVAVDANKPVYAPGEDATLRVRVKDAKGKGVASRVNVSMVDEALFSLMDHRALPLEGLYAPRYYQIQKLYTHKYVDISPGDLASMAEGGCFLPGTKILMADGTEKFIEDIQPGDMVRTFASDKDHTLVNAAVKETQRHQVTKYLVINGALRVTPEHRVLVNGEWGMIGDAAVGDTLTDVKGNSLRIATIEYERGLTQVYNFHVEKYHTYIADGVYVHNDKGGGGTRTDFPDVALFKTVDTDKNGEAEISLTLPDTITSWRATVQAISDTVSAGVTEVKIPVTLPVFVDTTVTPEYVAGDAPIVKLRSFGTDLKTGTSVTLGFDGTSLGVPRQEKKTTAFASAYFSFPPLREGTYTVTSSVAVGAKSDAVAESVKVVASRLLMSVKEAAPLTAGMKIAGSDTGRTEVRVTHASLGSLYRGLKNLRYSHGTRIDQKIARVKSSALLAEHFNETPYGDATVNGQQYQDYKAGGGVALLPYSSAELLLSAKAAAVAPEYFDNAGLSGYFYGVLGQNTISTEEGALALWGLASLGEPVLLDIRAFAKDHDPSPKEQLFLALGALELGDMEFAADVYKTLKKKYVKDKGAYSWAVIGNDKDDFIEETALFAVLAAGLHDERHDELFAYVTDSNTKDILVYLEELMYLSYAIPQAPKGDVSFTLSVNGKVQSETISFRESKVFSFTPEERASLVIENVSGAGSVVSSYLAPLSNVKEKDTTTGIERVYRIDNKATNSWKEGDIVTVELRPRFSREAPNSVYEITDILPSGLRLATRQAASGNKAPDPSCVWYPHDVNGQVVSFTVHTQWRCPSIYYTARVVNAGTYIAEPAIIQSIKSPSIMNISAAATVTITQ